MQHDDEAVKGAENRLIRHTALKHIFILRL